MSLTVACVLRSGGDYSPEWVYALRRGLRAHMPGRYRSPLSDPEPDTWTFVCLTDMAIHAPWRRPLLYHWPGWWSKLELFRPGLFETRVLYMDLDTLVVGDLTDLASYRGDWGMIRGFYRDIAQSGLMAWTPGPHTDELWADWLRSPEAHMARSRGDGDWLHERTDGDRLMDLYPGQVVSYKVHARDGIPEGARVVCGHGQPRFSDPAAGWAHLHWSALRDGTPRD